MPLEAPSSPGRVILLRSEWLAMTLSLIGSGLYVLLSFATAMTLVWHRQRARTLLRIHLFEGIEV